MNDKYGQKEISFTDLEELDNIKEAPTESIPKTEFDKSLKGLLSVLPMPKNKK